MLSVVLFVVVQAPVASNQVTFADLEKATKILRVAGLEFPGKGEYRTVTLEMFTFMFGPREVQLDGWVVTDEYTEKKSFVAWNGLTYDDFEIGPAADIDQDLKGRAIVGQFIADQSAEYTSAIYPRGKIAALLLYSIGREQEAMVQARRVSLPRNNGGLVADAIVQFDDILTHQVASRIKYSRDDDAYLLAKSLRRFRNFFDELQLSNGMRRRSTPRSGLGQNWVLDAWIVDLRRRLIDARTPEMSLEEVAKLPQDQRIDELIDRLDDSVGRLTVIAGENTLPPLSPDSMLARLGQAAVGALIPHMNDSVMTRSNGFVMRGFGNLRFETTGNVSSRLVHSALSLSVLPKRFGVYDLEFIQRYWKSVRDLPREEQWVLALETDELGPQNWDAAARNLSTPPWVEVTGTGRSIRRIPQIEVDTPRHQWNALDARAHDRVVRALENRTRELLDGIDREKPSVPDLSRASNLVIALATWDLDRARPVLHEILDLYLQHDLAFYGSYTACELASVLICGGDESGWDIYETLLEKLPEEPRTRINMPFAALWQHYDHPRAKQIAHRIFSTEGSWSAKRIAARTLSRLPIVALLPEFRNAMVTGFDDTEVALSARRLNESRISYSIPGGPSGGFYTDPEGTHIAIGSEFDVRWCDLLAIKLMRYDRRRDGFDPAWPIERRDAFIAKLKAAMERDVSDWSMVRKEVRPYITSFRPIFATSLPPSATKEERRIRIR